MIALDKLSASWFTPEGEDGDDPARFKTQGLNGIDFLEVSQLITIDSDNNVKMDNSAIRILLTKGLKDWENIHDSELEEIEFSKKMSENISRLPFSTCDIIAGRIFSQTQISGEDKKKS